MDQTGLRDECIKALQRYALDFMSLWFYKIIGLGGRALPAPVAELGLLGGYALMISKEILSGEVSSRKARRVLYPLLIVYLLTFVSSAIRWQITAIPDLRVALLRERVILSSSTVARFMSPQRS